VKCANGGRGERLDTPETPDGLTIGNTKRLTSGQDSLKNFRTMPADDLVRRVT
jgi:hypothetical protein